MTAQKHVPRLVTVILDLMSAALISLVLFAVANYWGPYFDPQRNWFFVTWIVCASLGAGYLWMRYPTQVVLILALFVPVILVLEMVLALSVGGPMEL